MGELCRTVSASRSGMCWKPVNGPGRAHSAGSPSAEMEDGLPAKLELELLASWVLSGL